mmetsp:Transcript_21442/g.44020  ORF Transcript_21442/g.44020 Transcript_21442/m.44020 type:complete len:516 (+) Transcript_21442:2-1549(+)
MNCGIDEATMSSQTTSDHDSNSSNNNNDNSLPPDHNNGNDTTPINNTNQNSPPLEEWEIRRDDLKSQGDAHFRSGSFPAAILSYQSALDLDPANHILLSNKSAAHLANGEKSKALVDARKCVEVMPEGWVKGHTRLAAAMASLGRFGEAAGVYQKVLAEIDGGNEVAKRGLEDCRRKERLANEEREREVKRVQMELDREKEEKERRKKESLEKAQQTNGPEVTKCKNDRVSGDEEDDLLDDFFSEVEKVTEKKKIPDNSHDNHSQSDSDNKNGDQKNGATSDGNITTTINNSNNRIKLELTNLGTSTHQINRLLQTNYEWKNLNPFYVLDIPHTIDDESIIAARYRALSLLVHPDKCPDDPIRAKTAFEQVRRAMASMNDEDKQRHVRALIDQGMKQGKRDFEEELRRTSGTKYVDTTKLSDAERQTLQQYQQKATMKIFAEIEQSRRDVEYRKRKFEQRERAQEDEEKEKEKKEMEHDKKWREVTRVEKRVGNWREFQGGGGAAGSGKKKSRWG